MSGRDNPIEITGSSCTAKAGRIDTQTQTSAIKRARMREYPMASLIVKIRERWLGSMLWTSYVACVRAIVHEWLARFAPP